MKRLNNKITNFIFPNLLLLTIAIASFIGSQLFHYMLNSTCAYKKFFGIICPFCGATRATINIFKLNLKDAFMFHPSTVILFFIILFLDIFYLINYKKDLNKKYYNFYVIFFGYIALTIIQYLVRLFFIFNDIPCNFMFLSL